MITYLLSLLPSRMLIDALRRTCPYDLRTVDVLLRAAATDVPYLIAAWHIDSGTEGVVVECHDAEMREHLIGVMDRVHTAMVHLESGDYPERGRDTTIDHEGQYA